MRSLIFEIVDSIDHVYSGWILWNLFLAFVPLLISFRLFRRRALPTGWFMLACLITSIIGFVGLWPRLSQAQRILIATVWSVQAGDVETILQLSWLVMIALLALLISLWLFQQAHTSKPWLWWIGLVIFIAFLPNAPYVLTDIIHLIRGTSFGITQVWIIALIFVPIHFCAILIGFEAYVISLLNINYFLKEKGLRHLIGPCEIMLHALSALGIYLGRFIRLNSWDVVVEPTYVFTATLEALTSRRPIALVAVTFIILTGLYWVMKQITLGLKLRMRYARQGLDVLE